MAAEQSKQARAADLANQQDDFYRRIFERAMQAHLEAHREQGLKACTPLCLGDMFERGWAAKELWVRGMLA